MQLFSKAEAINYLKTSQELFDYYDSKSLICYTLGGLERRYSIATLDKFKHEVLDKLNKQ
jgi:hypothetical protein